MISKDACMNTDLFGCTGPAYFTVAPFLVLCAPCVKARFGVDVDVPSSTRACDERPAPVASSTDPINASAGLRPAATVGPRTPNRQDVRDAA